MNTERDAQGFDRSPAINRSSACCQPTCPVLPDPISGLVDCDAYITFSQLAESASASGWSLDGIHAEIAESTVGALLERHQPRPLHYECSLLAGRCRRIVAKTAEGQRYASMVSPRKASGPDLAFLFIGGEGRLGTIERASIALSRPAPRYLQVRGALGDNDLLFAAARQITLLDPLALRRLDATSRTIDAYLPLRTSTDHHLVEPLESMGLQTQQVATIPTEQRYADPLPDGLTMAISAGYRTVSEIVQEALAWRGKKVLTIGFQYPDSHGVLATFTMAPSNRGFLEDLREKACTAGDLHLAEFFGQPVDRRPLFSPDPGLPAGGGEP
ncbi:MAG: FAD-binding oxidoreductase [Bradymonadales bacterium]|nr:FAD-binding oxidoreductase [Bradymonadales bacterium]